MFVQKLDNSIPRVYANGGQHAEMVARYTLTGVIAKADNTPFYAAADVLDYQVKSARATVCIGVDLKAHVAKDAAKAYAYVIKDFSMAYIMSPTEWIDFVEAFGTVTRDSQKNGGAEKIRLKSESKALRAWLQARA